MSNLKEIICQDCGAKSQDMKFKGFSEDEKNLEWKCEKCEAIFTHKV